MIYLLTRIEDVGYDEYDAKIIRAPNEKIAREIADKHCGDEGHVWSNPDRVKCESVLDTGGWIEILGSFNAG